MLVNIITRLHNLRKSLSGYILIEALSGISALAWGAWVLLPFWPLAFSKSTTVMLTIMPEHFWGAIFLASGALQFWGSSNGNRTWRLAAAIIACTEWGALAALFQSSAPGTTATPIYTIWSLANLVCVLFLALERERKPLGLKDIITGTKVHE